MEKRLEGKAWLLILAAALLLCWGCGGMGKGSSSMANQESFTGQPAEGVLGKAGAYFKAGKPWGALAA